MLQIAAEVYSMEKYIASFGQECNLNRTSVLF